MNNEVQYILMGAWLGIVTLEWVKLVYSSFQKDLPVSIVLKSKRKRGRLRSVRNMDCANHTEVG
jgi:hypothetical protein